MERCHEYTNETSHSIEDGDFLTHLVKISFLKMSSLHVDDRFSFLAHNAFHINQNHHVA